MFQCPPVCACDVLVINTEHLLINMELFLSLGKSKLNFKSQVLWKHASSQNSNYTRSAWHGVTCVLLFQDFNKSKLQMLNVFLLLSLKKVKPGSSQVQVKFQVLIFMTQMWLASRVSSPKGTAQEPVATAVRKFRLGQVITRVFTTWRFMHHWIKTGHTTQATSYTEICCC